MPTYEYKCNKCGNEFEKFQKISDPPHKTCPSCKGPVRRLISAGAGLLFKGSGFYLTDYRSESYKAGVKAEKKQKESPKEKKSEKTSTSTTKKKD